MPELPLRLMAFHTRNKGNDILHQNIYLLPLPQALCESFTISVHPKATQQAMTMDEKIHIAIVHMTLLPHAVFIDFSHWLPDLARNLGILPVYFSASSVIAAHMLIPTQTNHTTTATDDQQSIKENISFHERMMSSLRNCNAELEGHYLDYVEKQAGKAAIPCGPAFPIPPSETLVGKLATWLEKFEPGSVIYCSFGSECVLSLHQFQELVLGLELTGFPFLIALRPPADSDSIDSALPYGFKQRTNNIAMVTGDWVQQKHILNHSSTGCFVTHCGSGSLAEGLVSKCQLVLLPYGGDQYLNARVMSWGGG
ncbi:hypothetical protein QQ045_006190 [Rhodiola kirilowii]